MSSFLPEKAHKLASRLCLKSRRPASASQRPSTVPKPAFLNHVRKNVSLNVSKPFFSLNYRGQKFTIIRTTSWMHRNSKGLYSTEQTQQSKSNEQSETQEEPQPKQENAKASIVPDWPPFGKWPYAWLGLAVGSVFMFFYTWYIMREEKMIERYEFLKWGGDLDRLHSLRKLRKYLVYDQFGIIVSKRMADFGLADVTLTAMLDQNPQIRDLAVQVFCAFTANESLRPYLLDDLHALDELRKFADTKNAYAWYAISNLADNNEKACIEIANDEFMMQCLLDRYERACKSGDSYFIRPTLRLLANLAKYPESAEILTRYYGKDIQRCLNLFLMPETLSLANNINLRYRLVKHDPLQFHNLFEELQMAGITEEANSKLEIFSMLHQSILVGLAGVGWSLFRASRLKSKFYPLSRTERAWVKKAVYTSPVAAVLLSHSWFGTEKLAEYVSSKLGWESFRDARWAYSSYFLELPLYWVALNYIGPFATIPSLIRVRYRDTMPPYNYLLREPIAEILEDLEIIDDKNFDPSQPERFTKNMGEVSINNKIIREKLREDAEREERKKRWFW